MAQIFVSEQRGDLPASNLAVGRLKEIIGVKNKAFRGSKMQDASEFFGLLLTEIKESLDKFGLTEDNLIQSTFSLEIEEVLTCSMCGDQTRKVKGDLSMWCNVDSNTRLGLSRTT